MDNRCTEKPSKFVGKVAVEECKVQVMEIFSSKVPSDKKDKKSFQLNANCSLADSMDYMVNKFEQVRRAVQ